MKKLIKYVLLGVFCFTHQNLFSLEIPEEKRNQLEGKLRNTSISNSGLNSSAYEISASTGKSRAEIKIKPFSGEPLSVTFSAPLDKDSGESELFSTKTNVFSNAFKIKFNYEWNAFLDFEHIDNSITRAIEIDEICRSSPEKFGFNDKSDCNVKIDNLFERLKSGDVGTDESLLIDFWDSLLNKSITTYGFNASLGRDEYSYFSADLTNKITDTEIPWSVGSYVYWLKPNSHSFTLDLEYQKGYKAQSPSILCSNTPDENNLLTCINATTGAPIHKTNKNISITWNKKIKSKYSQWPIAVSPKVTHNFESDETAFSLPVYFLSDKPDSLTGGVKVDWESSNHEWYFGIFVGSQFSLN